MGACCPPCCPLPPACPARPSAPRRCEQCAAGYEENNDRCCMKAIGAAPLAA